MSVARVFFLLGRLVEGNVAELSDSSSEGDDEEDGDEEEELGPELNQIGTFFLSFEER